MAPTDLFSVKGKTALVTGASSGIGAHFARMLAREGANVVLAARRADKLAAGVAEIKGMKGAGDAKAVTLDVAAGNAAIIKGVEEAWAAFGRIDILVNNAGIFRAGMALEQSEADYDDLFDINVKGVFLVAREVAKKQAADGNGGSIINISSCVGNLGGVLKGGMSYSTTKVAVQHLTRCLALELGEHKIRVNSISPGVFPSEMSDALVERSVEFFKNKVPVPRAGNTEKDLDGTLLLFASDAGAYITGANLTVDGGLMLLQENFF